MARREVKANELRDADITFVSLVKRGANRIPFRVQKGDEGMFDLSTLFRKADQSPMIASVVVRKGADLDAQKVRLTKAGLSANDGVDTDSGTLFAQSGATGTAALKLDDDLAVVVSGPLATAFAEVTMKTEGFRGLLDVRTGFASPATALAVLKSELELAVVKGADAVADAAADFGAYMTTLVGALPPQVFNIGPTERVEKACAPKGKAPAEKGVDGDGDAPVKPAEGDDNDDDGDGAKDLKPAKGAKKDGKAKGAKAKAPVSNPDDPDDDDDDDSNEVTQPQDSALKPNQKADPALITAIQGLSHQLSDLKGAVGGLEDRVKSAEEVARKAEKAARGFIPGGAAHEDRIKSDTGGAGLPPLLDTAYNRNK